MNDIRDYFTEKFVVGGALCFLGAVVHVSKEYRLAQQAGNGFHFYDGFALFLSSIFAGTVFGLVATSTSNDLLHFWLSVCLGSFVGLHGLTRITENGVGILMEIMKFLGRK